MLIKLINKILNKINKRFLLNERALNLEKFNAFKVETLKGNVKRHFNVEGLPPHEWEVRGHPPCAGHGEEGHPLLL